MKSGNLCGNLVVALSLCKNLQKSCKNLDLGLLIFKIQTVIPISEMCSFRAPLAVQ